jgi:hypothetical protein
VSAYTDYISALIQGFWDYVETELEGEKGALESDQRNPQRPPVFQRSFADHNILIPPDTDEETRNAIVSALPLKERHRHFGSMRSSQVLAQSVFANLEVRGWLGLLDGLSTDENLPAFGIDFEQASMQLEYNVKHLGEPRPTSVDVWFDSEHRVAVECKLTEPDFGTCSRPRLRPSADPNYDRDFCDGTYTRQRNRQTRCSLSEIGVQYWTHIPEILHWRNDEDISPCVLRNTYQLVRNVLAACVNESGRIESGRSHALIIYDAANPAFQEGGLAREQLTVARSALREPDMLRSLSWQSLIDHLECSTDLAWLTQRLRAKYGFRPNLADSWQH